MFLLGLRMIILPHVERKFYVIDSLFKGFFVCISLIDAYVTVKRISVMSRQFLRLND